MDEIRGHEEERVQFALGGERDTVELRGDVPRWIANVLDAVVMARGGQAANVHRATVFNEVLAAWAEKKVHEASLVQRLAGCNPTGSETRSVREIRVVDVPQRGRA